MKFYSTKNSANIVTFREALLTGMPIDKGLYMPEFIPDLSNIFKQGTNLTFQEVALLISSKFLEKEITNKEKKLFNIALYILIFFLQLFFLQGKFL